VKAKRPPRRRGACRAATIATRWGVERGGAATRRPAATLPATTRHATTRGSGGEPASRRAGPAEDRTLPRRDQRDALGESQEGRDGASQGSGRGAGRGAGRGFSFAGFKGEPPHYYTPSRT